MQIADEAKHSVGPRTWVAITRRARQRGMSVEAWLNRQLDNDPGIVAGEPADVDELLFDLAFRHFRELPMEPAERQRLGRAMFRTLDCGEPTGPLAAGPQGRAYRFRRRAGSLEIRVGGGAMTLPLPQAMRLANLLQGGTLMLDDVAA